MTTPRSYHTATLLPSGTVLISGGQSGSQPSTGDPIVLASAEIYDPSTGAFTALPSLMSSYHYQHTATLLKNGKVLIAGGASLDASPLDRIVSACDLFDPASLTFSATGAMTYGRFFHAATLFPDGTVLVTGGVAGKALTSLPAEAYDPSSGSWSRLPAISESRWQHTAALVATGGYVIVVGGMSSSYPYYFRVLSTTETIGKPAN